MTSRTEGRSGVRRTELEEAILGRIRPSRDEIDRYQTVVVDITRDLMADPRFKEHDIKIKVVGSIAKGTQLSGGDLDLFLGFPEGTERQTLETTALDLGRAVLSDPEVRYAEHPYVAGTRDGIPVEVVPYIRVADLDDRVTAVDRTPFHTSYITAELDTEQADDVRLLKRFMQGIGVYGAEVRIQGFSGYLCELLVLHGHDFQGVLRATSAWTTPVRLTLGVGDPDGFSAVMRFPDPVDPRRNVAAAVGADALHRLVLAAQAFLDMEAESFFFPAPRDAPDPVRLEQVLRERGTHLLLISFPAVDEIDDILWSQLHRSRREFVTRLQEEGFQVLHARLADPPPRVLLELDRAELPKVRPHRGPPVATKHAVSFRAKHSNTYVKDGHLWTDRPRVETRALDWIARAIGAWNLGKHLNAVRDGIEWAEDAEAIRADPTLARDLLEPGEPWMHH